MAAALLAPILALLLAVSSTALADRASIWPEWRLPAHLARPSNLPGQRDLTYPAWMEGRWQLHSDNFDVVVQFAADANGAVVGDRAGNAAAIGRALLGEALLEVADDPANPNRQIALLRGNQGSNPRWWGGAAKRRMGITSGPMNWPCRCCMGRAIPG